MAGFLFFFSFFKFKLFPDYVNNQLSNLIIAERKCLKSGEGNFRGLRVVYKKCCELFSGESVVVGRKDGRGTVLRKLIYVPLENIDRSRIP